MNPSIIEISATVIFALAILHTFLVSKFAHIAHHYPEGSMGENFFHFMAEVEAVFGMWAAVFMLVVISQKGLGGPVAYLEGLNFTEPAFVFVIMAMAGTRPVIKLSERIIVFLSRLIPIPRKMAFYLTALVIGPMLGSFITEPAAMTVTAIILLKNFYTNEMSTKFKYATIGLLFVNVSIGGTLTHFAAPPVLMVAGKWGWGMAHMAGAFGYKAFISCVVSAIVISFFFKKELTGDFQLRADNNTKMLPPWWVTLAHVVFLALVVATAHHMVVFMGLFLFFLGFTTVTKEFQDEVQVKSSLMVGFFLAGLIVLGAEQKWWLQPLISSLSDQALFFGATALTGITDNAALTYLGSLVDLTDSAKYFLVAGAVTGGGLTVIANAPNPAGFGILKESFGKDGISPLGLLKGALFPTAVAILCFELLPTIAL
ncbi:MAG TPA: putative Na+/H+ antiporter [Bacteriovoracaceae bacterium]|nr:putative Na+/H+ antiporter [Bacteriovoracaceae bacterium]